jgi:hypothetical protein
MFKHQIATLFGIGYLQPAPGTWGSLAALPLALIVMWIGGPWLLHTLLGCAAIFAIVVTATRGRRLAARRAVGIPIGLLLHLVLDGTWLNSSLFWWPFRGGAPLGKGPLPEFDHLVASVVLEVVGIAIAIYLVRRYELTRPDRRKVFLRSGRLGRDVMRLE